MLGSLRWADEPSGNEVSLSYNDSNSWLIRTSKNLNEKQIKELFYIVVLMCVSGKRVSELIENNEITHKAFLEETGKNDVNLLIDLCKEEVKK